MKKNKNNPKKNKNIFLEALLLTLLVFLIGILLGVLFEQHRANNISEYYAQSEVSLMDILASNSFSDLNISECNSLEYYNVNFANKIYKEAKLLEDYENAGKITDVLKVQHRKYDVMRTLLWINTIKMNKRCNNSVHTIVYLYDYNSNDLTENAVNSVWSKVLLGVKEVYGDDLILIPIAVNNGVVSSEEIIKSYGVESYPAIIIDNKRLIEKLPTSEEIETYLV